MTKNLNKSSYININNSSHSTVIEEEIKKDQIFAQSEPEKSDGATQEGMDYADRLKRNFDKVENMIKQKLSYEEKKKKRKRKEF